MIRQAQRGQRDSKSVGSRQKRERLYDRERLHGDMDIRQYALPGNAEGFRNSPCGVEGLSPAAAFPPDSKAREDGYRVASRHQCGAPVESDSQGAQRMRHHHRGNRCLPGGRDAVPPSLRFSGMQTTLPPPLDLVSDGRGHHGRYGEPPSM